MKLESCVKDLSIYEILRHRHTCGRTSEYQEIAQNYVRKDTLIISFMAALPLSALNSFFDCSISRAMCSGPNDIGKRHHVLHHGADAARELVTLLWNERNADQEQKTRLTHSPPEYASLPFL